MLNQPQQQTPPPRTGGKRRESDRVRVTVGASVAAETDDLFNDWLARLQTVRPSANIGRMLDRLAEFAKRKKFDPAHPSLEPTKKGPTP